MEARQFDALASMLATSQSRRRLLAVLATLPLIDNMVDRLGSDKAEAKDRRRRRKQRHNKHKDPGNRKKGCRPKSKASVCAGQCGPVMNREMCGNTVDCGSCDCPDPCDECLVCQSGSNTPGACVPDSEQVGDPCGNDGQVCQANGTCACEVGSCANPTPICANGSCVPCSASHPCPTCQMCDGGQCVADAALQHQCGSCPQSDQWCDSGACAAIQATVRIADCDSLCHDTTTICGQTVTCPSCVLCDAETGCSSSYLMDGPRGAGNYCSQTSMSDACTTSADCAGQFGPYCQEAFRHCARICPY